ncbi:MAG: dTDP-4-dehydrorhamnose 3,5-epimerase RmlC [Oceanicaulis sp. HLUCCA04]|nr:MAG: dTDP-4-dehydrorhamnose 3,5-epimerase RmlC [Oceanicaulis sp. HLUCCA04]
MVELVEEALGGVKLVRTPRFEDERGFFTETWNARAFAAIGIDAAFVQDNHSRSVRAGTVRGLHYQAPPFAQAKLVRVSQGRVMDVAVDARVGSPSYGQHFKAELSADNGLQLFVPAGFLHGFMTLQDECHVQYKVDNYYDRASDGAVRFDDPDLGIEWGLPAANAILSGKDADAPFWREFASPFVWPGE